MPESGRVSHKKSNGGSEKSMTREQLKVLFQGYLDQLKHTGKCEVNLPQEDFIELRDFVKKCNYTTSEGNAHNVLNVHVDGKCITIGGY
jgi:hypothetical protein